MHYRQFLKLLALALLAFSLTISQIAFGIEPTKRLQPFQAQAEATPKPIAVINRKLARQTSLLTSEEVEKIKVLQSAVTPNIASNISSDGKVVVLGLQESGAEDFDFHLMNIQDGSEIAIRSEHFNDFEPVWFYDAPPKFYWQNAKTVVTLASKENNSGEQYALLKVDRKTGAVKVEPLDLPGSPLDMSPDASQVLVQVKHQKSTGKNGKHDKTNQKDSDDEEDDRADDETPTEYRVIALPDRKEIYRFALPGGCEIYASAWTPNNSHLALTQGWRSKKPSEFSWGGASLFARQSRNVMGLLPPTDNPYLQKNALVSINLQNGDQRTLYATNQENALFEKISWSPDGQTLLAQVFYPLKLNGRSYPIYDYFERGSYRLYDSNLKEVAHLNAPELSHFGDDIGRGQFVSPNELVFTALEGMDVHLYSYDRRSGKLHCISKDPGSYDQAAVIPNSHQIVFTYSSFNSPPELYQMSLDNGETTQLTSFNEEVAKANQTHAEAVSFTLKSGEKFDGVLIEPAKTPFPPHNAPLVVWQEGGPASSMTDWWNADVENPYALLPNFGISVLVLPIYGRYGFTTERFNALYNDRNFGQIDIDAMAEVVQQAIAKGYTAPGKVGVTGCSYGGYFTFQSIIRHPQTYAAANPQCSWVDMLTDWSGANEILPPFVYGSLTPYTDPAKFQQDSPVYNAAKIKTPLLIFHGSRDELPVTMLENIYWTVAAKGTPARMVKFMGAGHGLVDSEKRTVISEYELYAAQEMIQWFRTYLK